MKKGFILFLLSALLMSTNVYSQQINTLYEQKFESAPDYTVTGTTEILPGGDNISKTKAIRLKASKDGDVILTLPKINIPTGTKGLYLEFSHIAKFDQAQAALGLVEFTTGDGKYTNLKPTDYDRSFGGIAAEYSGGFDDRAYDEWWNEGVRFEYLPTKKQWKRERFKLSSYSGSEITIRFKLPKHKDIDPLMYGWLIDDIKIISSLRDMELPLPNIKMVNYPDPISYTTSQSMRISANITGSLASDSPVTLYYKVEGAANFISVPMKLESGSLYSGYIPFAGYGKLISWYIEAKGSNTLINTYPYFGLPDEYLTYKAERSVKTNNFLFTSSANSQYPLASREVTAKFEYRYGNALLSKAGYKAGNIKAMSFFISSAPIGASIQGFKIKLANIPTDRVIDGTKGFDKLAHFIDVYSGDVSITQGGSSEYKFDFPETFKWNGEGDILMQICFVGNTPNLKLEPIRVRVSNTQSSKFTTISLTSKQCEEILQSDPILEIPDVKFYMVENNPLVMDAGIVSVDAPKNYIQSGTTVPIKVTLKNYGAAVISDNNSPDKPDKLTKVDLFYQITDEKGIQGTVKTKEWAKSLDGQAEDKQFEIGTETGLTPGMKRICAWTGNDVWNKAGEKVTDHEPNNNKVCDGFIVCETSISGTRKIGGTNPDYLNIDDALAVLASCGITGSLTLEVEGGVWDAHLKFPVIPGLSPNNTITIKPKTGANVVIRWSGDKVNIEDNYLAYFENVNNVTFENIEFRFDNAKVATNIIKVGPNSNKITFDKCKFIANGEIPNTMIFIEGDSVLFKNSRIEGGNVAIQAQGDPANLSNANKIIGNTFVEQVTQAIYAINQDALEITSNTIISNSTLSIPIVSIYESEGAVKVTKNFINSLKGNICLGLYDVKGRGTDKTEYVVVANNMLSVQGEETETALIVSGEKVRILHNSILSHSSTALSSAISIGTSKTPLTTSEIYNNIFSSDKVGVAITVPRGISTSDINYNLYYSAEGILGLYSNAQVNDIDTWRDKTGKDLESFTPFKPSFLAIDNLKLYDRELYDSGIEATDITDDIFGTIRPTKPCVGAFEYEPLDIDVAMLRVDSPVLPSCNYGEEEVKVVFKNKGIKQIDANTLTLYYTVDGANQKSQSNSDIIAAGEEVTFTFTDKVNLSVLSGRKDKVFAIKAWSVHATDTLRRNDTTEAFVRSNYNVPALMVTVPPVVYQNPCTINLSAQNTEKYAVYWYKKQTDLDKEFFHKGNIYTTPPLEEKTTYYVSRKIEDPILKITEIQFTTTKPGATTPPKPWLNNLPAIEISNLGNVDILLSDYMFKNHTDNKANVLNVTLPNVVLKQGQSYVVQIGANSATVDISKSEVYTGQQLYTFSTAIQRAFFGLYNKTNNTLIDVVGYNTSKGSLGTPPAELNNTTLWNATANLVPADVAGIRRINPNSTDGAGWIVCDLQNPMSMGDITPEMIINPDNGCYGERAEVVINVTDIPDTVIKIVSIEIPEKNACEYTDNEPINVFIKNGGMYDIPVDKAIKIQVQASDKSTPVETIYTNGINIGEIKKLTLFMALNASTEDRKFTITTQVNTSNNKAKDADTLQVSKAIVSYINPAPPTIDSDNDIIVPYGSFATLKADSPSDKDSLVWYDNSDIVIDTTNEFTTGRIYALQTYKVRSLRAHVNDTFQLAKDAVKATKYDYPSTYSGVNDKNIEIYLITKAEMEAIGCKAGYISSIDFRIAELQKSDMQLDAFSIFMGHTTLTALAVSSPLPTFTPVYSTTNLSLNVEVMKHEFNTSSFYWDGQQNILVKICATASGANTGSAAGVKMYQKETSTQSLLHTKTAQDCSYTGTDYYSHNGRPDMIFGFREFRCVGEPQTVTVNPNAIPDYDLEIVAIEEPTMTTNNKLEDADKITVLIRNNGTKPINGVKLSGKIDNDDSKVFTDLEDSNNRTFNPGESKSVAITTPSPLFDKAGKHCYEIYVSNYKNESNNWVNAQDGYPENDTIRDCAAFCFEHSAEIFVGSDKEYKTFNQAVTALEQSGICGPVVVTVDAGTYSEQIVIPHIFGTSDENTITFTSATGDSNDVVLTYQITKKDSNYVVRLDNASYIQFKNMTIRADATKATSKGFAIAVELKGNTDNIIFANNKIEVIGYNSPAGTNTYGDVFAVNITGDVGSLSLKENRIVGGYMSIYTKEANSVSTLNIEKNQLLNFSLDGLFLEKIKTVTAIKNTIYTKNTQTTVSRGIYLNKPENRCIIAQNNIYLTKNAATHGIYISDFNVNTLPSKIVNNMISVQGSITNKLPTGIHVTNSSKIDIYYNTVQLKKSAEDSYCLYASQNNGNIRAKNNIFANNGGRLVFAELVTDITVINSNNYYIPAASRTFAQWGGTKCSDLDALRKANAQDMKSTTIQPHFVSDSILKLFHPDFSGKAEIIPNDEYAAVDIYDTERPVTGTSPSMGAHEYVRCDKRYDLALTDVVIIQGFPELCDGDDVQAKVKVKNYGKAAFRATENVKIRVELEGTPIFVEERIGVDIYPIEQEDGPEIVLENFMKLPYGTVGKKNLRAYLTSNEQCNNKNDTVLKETTIEPAFDLVYGELKSVTQKCELRNVILGAKISNSGKRIVLAGQKITLKADLTAADPIVNKSIAGDEIELVENILPNSANFIDVLYTTPLDLYPPASVTSDTHKVKYTVKGTVEYVYDKNTSNNTGTFVDAINSCINPVPPTGNNVEIPYATRAKLEASHISNSIENKTIRWYEDSNGAAQIHKDSLYTTVQLFDKKEYYIQVTSKHECISDYGIIKVTTRPQLPTDIGVSEILAPKKGLVYMGRNTDTVKVLISNYGTSPVSKFNVTFNNVSKSSGGVTDVLQTITEECTVEIPANGTYAYTFNTLLNIDPLSSTYEYTISAWTSLAADTIPQNDTVNDGSVLIIPLQEKNYGASSASYRTGLEITNVSFGKLNNTTPAIGNVYTLVNENVIDTSVVLYKGFGDTLSVSCEDSEASSSIVEKSGWVKVYIDWNRDTLFDPLTECVLSDTIDVNTPAKKFVKVPDNALNGFMKMRVVLYEKASSSIVEPVGQYMGGETEDYLVFVRMPFETNAALEKVLEPSNIIEGVDAGFPITFTPVRERDVKVKLVNLGKTALTSATIKYIFDDKTVNTVEWTGNLEGGTSEVVFLETHPFAFGKTNFVAWVESSNGGTDNFNEDDTTKIEFCRFHFMKIPDNDNFDHNESYFQALHQTGKNRNIWELGFPKTKRNILDVNTAPNVWITDLVNAYPKGNKSVLYSPIYDVNLRQPDTISFYLRKDMASMAFMRVEYKNWLNQWVKIGTERHNWYDSTGGFISKNKEYERVSFPISSVSHNFGPTTQIRFVFISSPHTPATITPLDGVAIDNYSIDMQKIAKDAGIVAILEPKEAFYGETIYPKVRLFNNGLTTLTSIPVNYIPSGGSQSFVPRTGKWTGELSPGDTVDYTFTDGLYIDKIFTKSFTIYASTRLPADYYSFNDTAFADVTIKPLMKDAGVIEIVAPSTSVVAGNTQNIRVRIQNYGEDPIITLPISYVMGDLPPVKEVVTINPSLKMGMTYDYIFKTPFKPNFGTFRFKAYTDLQGDLYTSNDTAYKEVRGETVAEDLSADYLVLDESVPGRIYLEIAFSNRGVTAVRDSIAVGYYVNNDLTTARVEYYHRTLPMNKQGHHRFETHLRPVAGGFKSICGFVSTLLESDRSNDTTCATTSFVEDVTPVELLVEEISTSNTCKVQMAITNIGNFLITDTVKAEVVYAGKVIKQDYKGNLYPGDTAYLIFDEKIEKSPNHVYNVRLITTALRDYNQSNDTVDNKYKLVDRIVEIGIDNVDTIGTASEDGVWLGQNYPNPFRDATAITFRIPFVGNVLFYVYDVTGKTILTKQKRYEAGEHTIKFEHNNLPSGIYYYGIEYNGKRLVKKMVLQPR